MAWLGLCPSKTLNSLSIPRKDTPKIPCMVTSMLTKMCEYFKFLETYVFAWKCDHPSSNLEGRVHTGSCWLAVPSTVHWQKLGPAESHTLQRKGRCILSKATSGSVIKGSTVEVGKRGTKRGFEGVEKKVHLYVDKEEILQALEPTAHPHHLSGELMDRQKLPHLKGALR